MLDAQHNRAIRHDCQDPVFAGVVGRITRYALALTAKQLSYARDQLRQQRHDMNHQLIRCKGKYERPLGLPCWHKMVALELNSRSPQHVDFDLH